MRLSQSIFGAASGMDQVTVMWDNRSVMHKATEWAGSDKFVRDMRRTSILDDTKDAYGVNMSA